jgi:hypothetical protein
MVPGTVPFSQVGWDFAFHGGSAGQAMFFDEESGLHLGWMY